MLTYPANALFIWRAIWCAFKCIWEWKIVPCGHSEHSIVLKLWWILCTWSFFSSRLGNRTKHTGQSKDCSVDFLRSGPKKWNHIFWKNMQFQNILLVPHSIPAHCFAGLWSTETYSRDCTKLRLVQKGHYCRIFLTIYFEIKVRDQY